MKARQIFDLLAHSSKSHNSQDLAILKPGAQNPFCAFGGRQGLEHFSYDCKLWVHISRVQETEARLHADMLVWDVYI